MPTLTLPTSDRRLERYTTRQPRHWPKEPANPFDRVALAAVHVVADPLANADPWLDTPIDWEATLAYRRHLWKLGFGVAEAMDTAQRGMGLDWRASLELIRRCIAEAKSEGGAVVFSGAGTDHLAPGVHGIDAIVRAYEEQIGEIEKLDGRVILMASRALAASATGPDAYAHVYDRILGQMREKAIIHWLGDMFDPALAGYWGHRDLDAATEVALDVIGRNADKIEGIKISLLDKDREIAMRRRLPEGVRMLTGDDFNFAELIAGDGEQHSDALLGILDAIAPAASSALAALARGSRNEFQDMLAPTVPLSRHIFKAPTRFYKTGIVFMAYLNGHQRHFVMIGGQQSARSIAHLAELFRLADGAGLLVDPELAAQRMQTVLRSHGIDA
ncbi:MAG TPA: dihydrodipicolinate synthase family protein [Stellaceae bacterium]|nr:dihydrodipicolinate synthase family protein [Stellaceae bacterium]